MNLVCVIYSFDDKHKVVLNRNHVVVMERDKTTKQFNYILDNRNTKKCETADILDYSFVNGTRTPAISFSKQQNKQYTVMMIDPDAPSCSNPTYKYWLHYLCINSDDTIVSYEPPTPPIGSGAHRYYIVVYEQSHSIVLNDDEKSVLRNRRNFDPESFVAKYGLTEKEFAKFVTKR